MQNVLQTAENQKQNASDTQIHQETTDNGGDFKYDEILRRISALGWSTD